MLRNPQSIVPILPQILFALLLTIDTPSSSSFGPREYQPLEKLIRCSDLVVRCKVSKTFKDGVNPSSSKMLHTKHVCDIQSYYIGTGPDQISIFTPGGIWTAPDGHQHLTQVPSVAAIREGEEMIAFLQRFGGGYRFLNQWGSKIEIDRREDRPVPTVQLRYQNPKYLSEAGRARYEKHDKRYEGRVDADGKPMKPSHRDTYNDLVPLDDVRDIIDLIVTDIGGPKPENLRCN